MKLFCRHRQEILHQGSTAMELLCIDCGRLRFHPLAGEPVRYHRTQSGGSISPPTGIEREALRVAREHADIATALNQIERREMAARVIARLEKK